MKNQKLPIMSQAKSPSSLVFKVERSTPQLIMPTKPTPHEFKELSDLDNLECFRTHVPTLFFYAQNPAMNGVDPSKVVRKAIAETLVFYYPFAGRLREGPSGKLILQCTGEGVLFIEADADVSLHQFGKPLAPPFPCSDQLLFDVPGSSQILNSPLLLVQVTRLKCGGFILGCRYNHIMSDGPGLLQFMTAIGEVARGAKVPSVLPAWERHVINSRNTQPVTSPLPEHQNNLSHNLNFPLQHDLRYRAFLFSPNDILALRRRLPCHIHKCSSFEIVAACAWKCRVVALQPHPHEEMSFIWPVNLRGNFNHFIPPGYYGNAMVFSISSSTAKEIIESPLSYTLGLLRKAQITITEHNYTRAVSDLMMSMGSYLITDLRYPGFEKVDFGWGETLYGGPIVFMPTMGCQLPLKTKSGKNGIILPICLPTQAMERFEKELKSMLEQHPFTSDNNIVKSKL